MNVQARSIRRCQHIKINGEQCGSPALMRKRHCYFHDRWRETRIQFNKEGPARFEDSFDLPTLEDAESIQVTLMQVLRLLIARHIDPKTAGLLLYGLQTASANLRQAKLNPEPEKVVIQPGKVGSVGLRENAWTPPLPPVEEMPAEERQKLASALLKDASVGEGDDRWHRIRVWAHLIGIDRGDPIPGTFVENAEGEPGKSPP
jgi:hypothetical protein